MYKIGWSLSRNTDARVLTRFDMHVAHLLDQPEFPQSQVECKFFATWLIKFQLYFSKTVKIY